MNVYFNINSLMLSNSLVETKFFPTWWNADTGLTKTGNNSIQYPQNIILTLSENTYDATQCKFECVADIHRLSVIAREDRFFLS
jgi:hypothetical protein